MNRTPSTNRRPRHCLPWVASLATATLLLAGCTPPASPPTGGSLSRPESSAFVTANDLAYPPELWGALTPSVQARLLRRWAAPDRSAWSLGMGDTLAAIETEPTPLTGAFALVQAGIATAGDLPAARVTAWWREAEAAGAVDQMWLAASLMSGMSTLPAMSPETVTLLKETASSEATAQARMADQTLTLLLPGHKPLSPSRSITVESPRDAAFLLWDASRMRGESPANSDRRLVDLALSGVTTDDWCWALLVRAYREVGDDPGADAVAAMFDARRILPTGDVLEPALFEGTVGSSFRMARYHRFANTMDSLADAPARERMAQAAAGTAGMDSAHRVAGDALRAQLGLPVDAAEADAALSQAGQGVTDDGPLKGAAQALAWTSLVEYGSALGRTVPYPGINRAAVDEWVAAGPRTGGETAARFLVALGDAGHLRGNAEVAPLVALVRTAMVAQPVEETPSWLLFAGALALQAWDGSTPVPPAVLRAQAETRRGRCLGGAEAYLRELPATSSACNVDSSWFAARALSAMKE